MILIDPSDVATIPIDWSDALPATSPLTLLSTVTHTATSPVVVVAQSDTTTTSQAKVSGGVHGKTYRLQATAVLTNGETINRHVILRCMEA